MFTLTHLIGRADSRSMVMWCLIPPLEVLPSHKRWLAQAWQPHPAGSFIWCHPCRVLEVSMHQFSTGLWNASTIQSSLFVLFPSMPLWPNPSCFHPYFPPVHPQNLFYFTFPGRSKCPYLKYPCHIASQGLWTVYMVILSFTVNIHLQVSTNHICVSRLPYSGWFFFYFHTFACKSWSHCF